MHEASLERRSLASVRSQAEPGYEGKRGFIFHLLDWLPLTTIKITKLNSFLAQNVFGFSINRLLPLEMGDVKKPLLKRGPGLFWSRWALVLAISFLFAPGELLASCGDYVMVGGQENSRGHTNSSSTQAEQKPGTNHSHNTWSSRKSVPSADVPGNHPQPCNWPGCAPAPHSFPLVYIPPVPTNKGDQCGFLPALLVLSETDIELLSIENGFPNLPHHRLSIFHPPRTFLA